MATPIPTNRCSFTLAEAALATGGEIFGPREPAVSSVSIDTRTLERGAIFVALVGVTDGHKYLDQAAELGASAAIVGRGRRIASIPCIEVDDTLDALGALARFHLGRIRRERRIPSIAIGGAAGKTTTKEITAALARALFGNTLATPGNLNNRIGVPMTLLTLTREHRAMVIECGTNMRGEIPRLAAIVEPDVTMVLNVDLEHTEGLGTLEDVADEEASLFRGARRVAVLPAGDPTLAARAPAGLKAVTFGVSPEADVRLEARSVGPDGRTRIRLAISPAMVAAGVAPVLETEIAMLGEAAAVNCAAAFAAVASAVGSGLSREQLGALETALSSVAPVAGRLSIRRAGDIVIIDDTYNANPRSVRAALDAARETADRLGARLLVALGDMLELGDLSASAHEDAIADVLQTCPAVFVAVGPEMTRAIESTRVDPRGTEVLVSPESPDAARQMRERLRPGDVVLVKGSRGIAMERIVEAIEHRAQ